LPYDQNADPNQVNQANQAEQADQASQEAQARTPATHGRFAQGFGARAKTRGGLGQRAMDASRMFWEDQPRAPEAQKTFGNGSAVGYTPPHAGPAQGEMPPGYQQAHFVDMMGKRHDYLDKIADPMDMSYLNDKYRKHEEPKHEEPGEKYPETKPAEPVVPATPAAGVAQSAETARPDAAPVARQVPMVSEPPVDIKSSIPKTTPNEPVFRVGTPLSSGWGQMTPSLTVPYGTPQSAPAPVIPSTPTQATGWDQPAETPPFNSTAPGPSTTPPAPGGTPITASGWGPSATPLPSVTAPRKFTAPVTSDVRAKEEIKSVDPIDVDGFLRALSEKK
jgi:hypothetical protein